MKESDYSVTDLVTNESFQRWVQRPDAENHAFWQDWLARHPEKKDTLEQARLMLLAIDFRKTPPGDVDQARLLEKIQVGLRADSSRTVRWRNTRRWQFGAAAVLASLLTLGGGYYLIFRYHRPVRYTTTYGDRRVIALPDGSVVTLNAHSSLRFAAQWPSNRVREVWLEGEAYFDVRKRRPPNDAGPPLASSRFIVHTGDLDIEVLGTQFNVNNRRGTTRVVLTSGRIRLQGEAANGAPTLTMEPSELVEYAPASRQLVKRKVDPARYASWVRNQLIFRETPLKEIAQVLEDNYGWRVAFGDTTLAKRKFTGSAPADTAAQLLTAIATSFNVAITRTDDGIIIGK